MPEIIKIGDEKYAIMGNLKLGIKRYDFAPSLNLDSSFDIKYFYKDELVEDTSLIEKLNAKYLRKFGVISKDGKIGIYLQGSRFYESSENIPDAATLDKILEQDLEDVLKMYTKERGCDFTDPLINELRENFKAKDIHYSIEPGLYFNAVARTEEIDGKLKYSIVFDSVESLEGHTEIKQHEILHALVSDGTPDLRRTGFDIVSLQAENSYNYHGISQEEGFVVQFFADSNNKVQASTYNADAFIMEFCKDIVGYKSIMQTREAHSVEDLALNVASKIKCDDISLKLMFKQSDLGHVYKNIEPKRGFLGINVYKTQYKEAVKNFDTMLKESLAKNGADSPEFKLLLDTCKKLGNKYKKSYDYDTETPTYLAKFLNRSVKAIEHCQRAQLGLQVDKVAARRDFTRKLVSDVTFEAAKVLHGRAKIKSAIENIRGAREEYNASQAIVNGKEKIQAPKVTERIYRPKFNPLKRIPSIISKIARNSAKKSLDEIKTRAQSLSVKPITNSKDHAVNAAAKLAATANAFKR